MLKYAAINTLFAMLITGVITWLIWLCIRFVWLFIPLVFAGIFIWFCFDYNDKGDEN